MVFYLVKILLIKRMIEMKNIGAFLCGLAITQHNFYVQMSFLITGLGLITVRQMLEPWPNDEENKHVDSK